MQQTIKVIREKRDEESYFLFDKEKHNTVIKKYIALKKTLKKRLIISYAIKANPHEKIIKNLVLNGITHFDCASINEIKLAGSFTKIGNIMFNHPIKRKKDIEKSLTIGVRHFTVDSQAEINKINFIAKKLNIRNIEIAIRISTKNKSSHIKLSEKFGIEIGKVKSLETYNYKVGLSFHLGSQNLEPQSFYKTIKHINESFNLTKFYFLNIGGGIPEFNKKSLFKLEDYFKHIKKGLELIKHNNIKIIFEVGRGLVAECINLIIPIIAVKKDTKSTYYYINDGIFSSFSDYYIHDWKYNFYVYKFDSKPKKEGRVILFGRTCHSGDKIELDTLDTNCQPGDYLIIKNAGAYTYSQASDFNGFNKHKVLSSNHHTCHQ